MSSTGLPPVSLWGRRTVAAVVLAMFAAMALALQLVAHDPTATPLVIGALSIVVARFATKLDPAARGVHRLVIGACTVILVVSALVSLILLGATTTGEIN